MNRLSGPGSALKQLFFLAICISLLVSCKKSTSTDFFTVSGSITNVDTGASAVTLTLSNSENSYQGQAASSGTFSIANVVPGNYSLRISQEKSSGHVERTVKANVGNGNLVLSLILPDPVVASSPSHTDRSITLAWTRSTDAGFREYKVYRGYNPGLDETTGDLINVFTQAGDTTFTDAHGMTVSDGLMPNTTYYYRVMVMDEFGKIAGSNLLMVKTDAYPPAPELYTLEEVTNFPANGSLGVIYGLAFDGNFLWLAYKFSSGGYYDSVTVTLVQYDYINSRSLKSFVYKEVYPEVGGLEFDGTHLWLQLTKPGNDLFYKIDPSDGSIINTFTTDYGVRDLAFYNGALYINYYYNKMDLVNPLNGALTKSIITQISPGTNCRGLAVRSGEIWVSYYLVNLGILYVMDENASVTGFVKYPLDGSQICFMNGQLVLNDMTRVYIYNIISKGK